MSKTRIGAVLLISLIPAFVAIGALPNAEEGLILVANSILAVYILTAIIAGLIFFIVGKREDSTGFKDAVHYAERNSWHPITKTSWRSIKGDNVSLSVNKSRVAKSFILSIEADRINHTVEEFEKMEWAMRFGDWLWNYLVQKNVQVSTTSIDLAKSEWAGS